jgi:hypothetical protein
MAIKQVFETQESMEFADFMEYAERQVDMTDQDALLRLGEQVTMLGNNRRFLTDFMAEYVQQNLEAGDLVTTISQAVELARTPKFYVRFAFWLPEDSLTPQEHQLFAYTQAHDHNFDLLTYGYCGSGYRTDIYEYDYDSVRGYVGEPVSVRPLGEHQHRTGDVLLYRCSKDIHLQYPPDAPSITLNIVPLHNEHGLINQYFFNLPDRHSERAMLSGHVDSNMELRNSLYNIASHFPGEKTTRMLADVVEDYACQRSRYEALRALAKCDADTHQSLCRRFADDPSPLLRHYITSISNGA